MLLSYPYLEGDPKYTFGRIDVGRQLRTIEDDGDRVQQAVVDSITKARASAPKLVFVNKTKKLFAGHEPYAEHLNRRRWFVEPMVDALPDRKDTWYHPKPIGWQREARMVASDPRVPKHDLLPTSLSTPPEPVAPGPAPPVGTGASVSSAAPGSTTPARCSRPGGSTAGAATPTGSWGMAT